MSLRPHAAPLFCRHDPLAPPLCLAPAAYLLTCKDKFLTRPEICQLASYMAGERAGELWLVGALVRVRVAMGGGRSAVCAACVALRALTCLPDDLPLPAPLRRPMQTPRCFWTSPPPPSSSPLSCGPASSCSACSSAPEV